MGAIAKLLSGSVMMLKVVAFLLSLALASAALVSPNVLFAQGFESNADGWEVFGGSFNAVRVSSGTNGVPSATGSFHAENASPRGAATNWGGYDSTNGGSGSFVEYVTSVKIYLDTGAGFTNDARFDFSSAINNQAMPSAHRRDFVFNAGFYNDATGPGANPKNPARMPIAISTTGYYRFQHHFRDNAGVLEVELSIFDASESLVSSWILSNPTDLIATEVGGNRYGWFVNTEFTPLGFDDSFLAVEAAPSISPTE